MLIPGLLIFSVPLSVAAQPHEFMIGVQAWSFNHFTAMKAVEMAAKASAKYIEFYPGQKLEAGSDVAVGPQMGESATEQLEGQLSKFGVKAVAFGVTDIPKDPEQARILFRWAKKMGLLVINTESDDSIDTIEMMVKEFDIKVGFHDHPKRPNDPSYRNWDPNYILSLVKNRDHRIGSCADIGHWVRSGVKPLDALHILRGRIVSSHMKDLNEFSPDAHDVPFGTGISDISAVLKEFKAQGFNGPASVEYEYDMEHSLPEVAACIGFVRGWLSR